MNKTGERIASEIRRHGVIPFARFMELALYCPVCGYYEQEADNLGRNGDYFTCVSVGPLFGELLAFQFAEWLSELKIGPFYIIEAGAHDGKLAGDILTWLRKHRPALFARLEYDIVEPSARRQEWQCRTLAEFGDKVRWFLSLSDLRSDSPSPLAPHTLTIVPRNFCGVFFSNELLDALPVHRLGWDATRREWFEWGVGLDGDRFNWARLSASQPPRFTLDVPPELHAVLPDGFTTEVCPAATDWWREAASTLHHGKLLTLDYGLLAEEFFAPHRHDGTLRAYRRHQLSGDVLAHAGEQDLTAHVNFTAIQAAGEAAGLTTESFTTQAQFLVHIAEQTWRDKTTFGDWNTERLSQFKTLTHPEHLGRAFRALLQSNPT